MHTVSRGIAGHVCAHEECTQIVWCREVDCGGAIGAGLDNLLGLGRNGCEWEARSWPRPRIGREFTG